MKVTFVREALRTREPAQTETPVCVVGFLRGDPQAPPPEGVRADIVRTMRPPPRRVRAQGADDPTSSGGELRIDTLLLTSSLSLYALPGLDAPQPSRLRDTVQLLLEGLPSVEVMLVTSPLEAPLEDDDVLQQLRLALGEHPGRLLAVPDLDPPEPMARGERGASIEPLMERLRARFLSWERKVLRLGPLCRESFLTGLFDAPQVSAELLYTWCFADDAGPAIRVDMGGLAAAEGKHARQQALERAWAGMLEASLARLTGLDLAVCLWVGPWERLRMHGWRSAAAVAMRTLASQPGAPASQQLERRRVALGGGRDHLPSLEPKIFARFPGPLQLSPVVAKLIVPVRLELRESACSFEGQHCLRAPVGFWPIPAVRSLKHIELHLRQIAERFVFQAASEMQALELANAIRFALDEYLRNGVLAPLETAPAMVRARAELREEPGLVAEVEGSLRPWSYAIKIKLHVRPGSVMLEAA